MESHANSSVLLMLNGKDETFNELLKIAYGNPPSESDIEEYKEFLGKCERKGLIPSVANISRDELSRLLSDHKEKYGKESTMLPLYPIGTLIASGIELLSYVKRTGSKLVPEVPAHEESGLINAGNGIVIPYSNTVPTHPAHYEPTYAIVLDHPKLLAATLSIGILATGLSWARDEWRRRKLSEIDHDKMTSVYEYINLAKMYSSTRAKDNKARISESLDTLSG